MKFEMLDIAINRQDLYTFSSILIALFLLYFITGQVIKNSRMANDQKRRFMVNLRNILVITVLGSIFTLWATELYQFVISVAALMAAFAIAGKEVFLCFGGGFYKAFARPFSVGDRIEVNGVRGDVVDIGLMSTQLLEIGPKDYTQQMTGRMITIPNSIFLGVNVYNESDTVTEGRDFALHTFKVPIKNDGNWSKHKEVLLEAAREFSDKYNDRAIKFFNRLASKRQVDVPLVQARVNIKFDSADQILLIARVCIPVDQKGILEQKILQSYLSKTH